jgi:hypothetical protein
MMAEKRLMISDRKDGIIPRIRIPATTTASTRFPVRVK